MFSGLTNQVSSWMGAAKDEDVPVPQNLDAPAAAPQQPAAVEATQNNEAGEQPVDGEDGRSGMFSNVKGWLGSASIPSMPAMPAMPAMSMPAMPAMPGMPSIPGLRKGGAEEGNPDGLQVDPSEATGAVSGDDEDKSRYISATEGADSHPASGGGSPTGEDGQIGQVTTKVTQGAKHFGSFLSSAINKAGAKIKETVKDNTILGEFNKEQEAFIKGQGGAGDSGAAPWVGHSNEAKIKEEILGLSQDRRNFVRAPPAGVDFTFDYETAYPTAIAIMAEDPALEKMRFELVPKIITEENFWKNYFYRVSLIIQAAELGTLGADGVGQGSSEDEEQWEKDLEAELQDYEVVKGDRGYGRGGGVGGKGGGRGGGTKDPTNGGEEEEEELATISNLRSRSSPSNDWEQYADLIDETDDLKTLKSLKKEMLGYS